jgi:hypothetical protein
MTETDGIGPSTRWRTEKKQVQMRKNKQMKLDQIEMEMNLKCNQETMHNRWESDWTRLGEIGKWQTRRANRSENAIKSAKNIEI